jgi:hypothetical protein
LKWRQLVLGLTGIAWNGGSRFWPDWNGLEVRIEEICFGLNGLAWNGGSQFWPGCTGMAWNEESQVWPDWNGLEWRKSVLV